MGWHGNQIRGSLSTHDTGDLRHRQHVAFFHAAALDQGKSVFIDQYTGGGHGHALGHRLFAHIHHFGAALFIKMGKIRHG